MYNIHIISWLLSINSPCVRIMLWNFSLNNNRLFTIIYTSFEATHIYNIYWYSSRVCMCVCVFIWMRQSTRQSVTNRHCFIFYFFPLTNTPAHYHYLCYFPIVMSSSLRVSGSREIAGAKSVAAGATTVKTCYPSLPPVHYNGRYVRYYILLAVVYFFTRSNLTSVNIFHRTLTLNY